MGSKETIHALGINNDSTASGPQTAYATQLSTHSKGLVRADAGSPAVSLGAVSSH